MTCKSTIPASVCVSPVPTPARTCKSLRKLVINSPCVADWEANSSEVRCVCHYSVEYLFTFVKLPAATQGDSGIITVRYWKDLTPEEPNELNKILVSYRYKLFESHDNNLYSPWYNGQTLGNNFTLEFWDVEPGGLNIVSQLELELGILDCGGQIYQEPELCLSTGVDPVPVTEEPLLESGQISETREPGSDTQ